MNLSGGSCKGQKVTAFNSASRNTKVSFQNYGTLYCNGILSSVFVPRLLKNLIMQTAFSSERLMIRGVTSISPYSSYCPPDNFYPVNENFLSRFLDVSGTFTHCKTRHIALDIIIVMKLSTFLRLRCSYFRFEGKMISKRPAHHQEIKYIEHFKHLH